MNWKKQYQKALTFSYDDGNVQDKKLLDILNRYGMKCTFNVNTGLDFDHGTWVYRDVLEVHRLNLAECPELYAGHEMAVHGVYHYNLTELSPAEPDRRVTGKCGDDHETLRHSAGGHGISLRRVQRYCNRRTEPSGHSLCPWSGKLPFLCRAGRSDAVSADLSP